MASTWLPPAEHLSPLAMTVTAALLWADSRYSSMDTTRASSSQASLPTLMVVVVVMMMMTRMMIKMVMMMITKASLPTLFLIMTRLIMWSDRSFSRSPVSCLWTWERDSVW